MSRVHEKVKLLVRRIVWGILFLVAILACNIEPPTPEVEIVDDNGYINEYGWVDIEIEFNVEVNSGYVTVAFYDASDKLLATQEEYFWGYDNKISKTFYSIPGKVDSYEIVTYDITAHVDTSYVIWFILLGIFSFGCFISSLFLSCKVYQYDGKIIIVYAGWYHHYIKVDGEKFDEHNTISRWTAIVLTGKLDDKTELVATISLTNRIALKINDKLYTKMQ